MLDILLPLPAANQALVPECIQCISRCTDVPFRLVVIADGGTRMDLLQLEGFLSNYQAQWKLLHNEKPVYLNQTLREGLEDCNSRITAIIAPQVRLDDVKWFGKMQQIFHRDSSAFVVDTTPNTKSATLYPMKRSHMHPTGDGCRFAVVQTAFVKNKNPYGRVDPISFWSRAAIAGGGSSWTAPGVRYHLVDCVEHETWREPLASPNPSA